MAQTIMGHPRGLIVCVLTEIWERFAYYGTLSLLILYLTKSYLLSDVDGNLTVGAIGALLTMSPVIGGMVADRWLGSRKSIVVGCVFMSVGFLSISLPDSLVRALEMNTGPNGLPSLDLLLISMAIIIVGNGFVKSSLADVVGSLYEPSDMRRESGFTFVYWGINFGAVIGPVACGAIAEIYGMRYGFSVAGIGMLIALVTFVSGQKHFPPAPDETRSIRLRERVIRWLTLENLVYLGGAASVLLFWQLLRMHTIVSSIMVWFGICLGLFMLYFSLRHCERQDRDRMLVIGSIIFFTVIYAVVNYQIYGSLILFSDRYVDRLVFGYELPASLVVSMMAVMALWMTPIASYLWMALERKGKNPNSVVKIGFGMILTGAAYFAPLLAAVLIGYTSYMSLAWILLLGIILVAGEICVTPIVQSVISTISPRRIAVMMLGSFMFAIALGSSLAGEVAAAFTVVEPGPDGAPVSFEVGMNAYVSTYLYLGILAVVTGVGVLIASPTLYRHMHIPERDTA